MNKHGEVAVVVMVVGKLPEIMREVAKPMEQIEKITVIDNGGNQGATRVSKMVTNVAGAGFQVIKNMTGVDISHLLGGITNKPKVVKEEAEVTDFRENVE